MLDDIIAERRKKVVALRSAGVDPYPARTGKGTPIAEVQKKFSALAKAKKKVCLVGRLTAVRDQGNVIFGDLTDESGSFQALLRKDITKNFVLLKKTLDRGDFISVEGTVFKTKRGEQSVEVRECVILTKSLRPIPTEWFGIEDTETRLRKRYLDMLLHPELKELFRKKSLFWQETRLQLLSAGFLEVETPVLEAVPGGAEAEPFVTHHNALNTDFYLRISPELNLKRLMVAGFEKVFEIGRIFRNEGIDAEHLQDYTQMEVYWAYQDYEGLMNFLEKMIKVVIKKTFKTSIITHKGKKVDWSKKWVRYDYMRLFEKETGLSVQKSDKETLMRKAKELGIDHIGTTLGKGRLIDLIYKKTVRPKLMQPGFLVNPPVDIEPLAKRMASDPTRVERFQLVAYGTELGKGFSELNDPEEQRARFEEQARLRATGDTEAQMPDDDYVEALEYGMPPTAGFGMSERLFAVLADKPVREAVFFPLMKSKGKS